MTEQKSKGKFAIIGGSGIEELPIFKDVKWERFNTNYQEETRSDSTLIERLLSQWFGVLGPGVVEYQEVGDVIFIKRHGSKRGYAPSCSQYIANLIAAKMLGARIVIGISAVGSLHEDRIGVEDLVIPHTYIDETKGRVISPFKNKLVIHANRWPAFPERLRAILYECAGKPGELFHNVHKEGTYVVIPGDGFGTEGEHHKRKTYADVVGMTIFPEALASLLNMEYACAAVVVDLDKDANHEHGTRQVMEKLSQDQHVPKYIERLMPRLGEYLRSMDTPSKFVKQKLAGNIIPYCPEEIPHKYLRHIAKELVATYCGK